MYLVSLPAIDLRVYSVCHGAVPDSALTLVMATLTLIGSGWTMLLLVPLTAFKATRAVALSMAKAGLLAAALVFVLKIIVRRPRPCAVFGTPALWGGTPLDYSFPSGHSTGAFLFAAYVTVLCLRDPAKRRESWRWAFAAGAFALAGAIAFSRVYLGVHFPTDVLAGAVLGTTMGAAFAVRLARLRERY